MGAGEERGQRLLELQKTPGMSRDNLARRSLQKNGCSNHRHEDHYGSHDQPVSPHSPCPRRPICRLLRIVGGSRLISQIEKCRNFGLIKARLERFFSYLIN